MADDLIERRSSVDPRGTPNLCRKWMDDAVNALASKDKALEEARQYIAKLQTQNIMEIGAAVHQVEVAEAALSEMRAELERAAALAELRLSMLDEAHFELEAYRARAQAEGETP